MEDNWQRNVEDYHESILLLEKWKSKAESRILSKTE